MLWDAARIDFSAAQVSLGQIGKMRHLSHSLRERH